MNRENWALRVDKRLRVPRRKRRSIALAPHEISDLADRNEPETLRVKRVFTVFRFSYTNRFTRTRGNFVGK